MLKKLVFSLMMVGMLAMASVGFASPSSDALAKEDPVATSLISTMLGGGDLNKFKPNMDSRVNMEEVKKAYTTVPGLNQVKAFRFVLFERNGMFDRVAYLAPIDNNNAVLISVAFDANTHLIVGMGVEPLGKAQAPAK